MELFSVSPIGTHLALGGFKWKNREGGPRMQSILISFAITFIGVIAAVLLFSVAMRGRKEDEEPKPSSKAPTGKGQFFLNDGAGSEPVGELPADGLPLEVERHVRLEHEAAEGFARSPNADTLQAPSVSDLRRNKGP